MKDLKSKLYEIIFEADTPYGKAFDVALIISVILSVLVVMLESVESLEEQYGSFFIFAEWFFTIIFSIELALRLFCVDKIHKYLFSFYGIIDLVSILPAYLTSFFPGLQSLGVIRALRILRIFRILKLNRYMLASLSLTSALKASKHKIIIFLGVVITLVFVIGAIMYLVEGKENGFTSIPKSIYWAIVTITTVGFGDMVPKTPLGQIISSFLMIAGYGILAVPTGLVSAEMVYQKLELIKENKPCTNSDCDVFQHDPDAVFCSKCGSKL
jgi:voltage-gated potassium channel